MTNNNIIAEEDMRRLHFEADIPDNVEVREVISIVNIDGNHVDGKYLVGMFLKTPRRFLLEEIIGKRRVGPGDVWLDPRFGYVVAAQSSYDLEENCLAVTFKEVKETDKEYYPISKDNSGTKK